MERKKANLLHCTLGIWMKKRQITFRCHSCACVFTPLRHQSVCKWSTNPGQCIICKYKLTQFLPLRNTCQSIKCLCLPGSDMRIYSSRMKGLQSGWKVGSNWGVLPYNHPAPPEYENSKTLKRNTQRQWSTWCTTVSLIITHCEEIQPALRTHDCGCPKDMYVQKNYLS